MNELDVSARSFHKRADRGRVVCPRIQVSLPVSGDLAILGVHGTLIDEPARVDEARDALVLASVGLAHGPSCAQLLGQIAAQSAPVREVEALVDGLDADLVSVMVDAQVSADLLRTPLQLELVLDEGVQPHARGELGSAGALRLLPGVLIGETGLISLPALSTAKFSADCRRAAFEPTGDLTQPVSLSGQRLNPLALEQREINARG